MIPTHSRDCQSGVDVKAAITIVMADSNVQFLEQSYKTTVEQEKKHKGDLWLKGDF